jgi:membrane-bound metal-dependent hydrolase YbcI (DUF457 family)
MEWISHSAVGHFLGQIIIKPGERPRRAGWWWILASICPDWLEFLTRWFGDIHRGVTHSLYMWPLLALAWTAAARRWGRNANGQIASWPRLWAAFFVVVGSHLVLDVFMPYRIYLAWPFSQVNWKWDVMPLYDVYIFAGWLILWAVQRKRNWSSAFTARVGLAIFLLVFAVRGGGKLRANALAKDLAAHADSSQVQAETPIRTIPTYYQPWIWYVRLGGTEALWTPINVITGEVLGAGRTINPWFPPLPGREHIRLPKD